MKKKAIISVSSSRENDKDKIEVVTPGKFYKRDSSYYAEYAETEVSGMEGTDTTFKIDNNNFSLIRIGSTNASMDFNKERYSMSIYDTPYGALELRIKTNKLKIDISENGGNVFIDYNLSVSGQKYQNTKLKINIKIEE